MQSVHRLVTIINLRLGKTSNVEAKIYSQTDIFSVLRLQRSKHSNNCDRSSEQQDILALGWLSIPETIIVCTGIENHVQKYIVEQHVTFCLLLWKGRTKVLAHGPCLWAHTMLQQLPNLAIGVDNTWLSDFSTSIEFFPKNRCLNRCNLSLAKSWVEDCLELTFKYVDYQTLAHL